MERSILRKLRESRGISLGTYKGYSLIQDEDNEVSVYKSGKLVHHCESDKEAYDFIDDIPNRTSSNKRSVQYCVKVQFPDRSNWYYLCKDGHYKKESQVTKQNVRTFDAKNKAYQALSYSTRSLNYVDKKVDIFR